MPHSPVQRTQVEVDQAPPEVVSAWLRAGELQDLLAGRDPGSTEQPPEPPAEQQVDQRGDPELGVRGTPVAGDITDPSELANMSPEQIVAARKQGRLRSIGVAP